MSRSSRRGPWLPEEDATLLHLVRTQGPNNWVRISQHMLHRSPKQCRERYHQNLKPSLNHEPISPDEGEVIERLVQQMGKRWAEIARRLGNRSDNAVKNWWNGSMNRRKRNTIHHGGGSKMVGYRSHPMPASDGPRPPHLRQTSATAQHAFNDPAYALPPPFPLPRLAPSMLPSPVEPPRSIPPSDYLVREPAAHGLRHGPRSPPSYLAPPRGGPVLGGLSPSLGDGTSHLPRDARPHPLSFPPGPSSARPAWQLPPLQVGDAPLASPAATEASQASSNQQAPSLVSDTQSNCSISPKTVTSPRPGGPAAHLSAVQLWPDMPRRKSTGNYADERPPYVQAPGDDGYPPEYPGGGTFAPAPFDRPPLAATLHTLPQPDLATSTTSSPGPSGTPRPWSTACPPPTASVQRDHRMNVSRLLE